MRVDDLALWKRYKLSNGQYLRSNEFIGLDDKDIDTDIIIHKNRAALHRYYELFTTYRPSFKSTFKPSTVFEIGVKEGGSLCMWYDIFKCPVVGIDNNITQLSVASLEYMSGRNIIVGHVDANNPQAVMAFKKRNLPGSVDLIIDDCMHTIEQIPYNLNLYWIFVSVGGMYIIEDWKGLHELHQGELLSILHRSSYDCNRIVHLYNEMIVIEKTGRAKGVSV